MGSQWIPHYISIYFYFRISQKVLLVKSLKVFLSISLNKYSRFFFEISFRGKKLYQRFLREFIFVQRNISSDNSGNRTPQHIKPRNPRNCGNIEGIEVLLLEGCFERQKVIFLISNQELFGGLQTKFSRNFFGIFGILEVLQVFHKKQRIASQSIKCIFSWKFAKELFLRCLVMLHFLGCTTVMLMFEVMAVSV